MMVLLLALLMFKYLECKGFDKTFKREIGKQNLILIPCCVYDAPNSSACVRKLEPLETEMTASRKKLK